MAKRIPIPREIMAEFKRMAGGSKRALDDFLRGYRREFRRMVAAGESPSAVHEAAKNWHRKRQFIHEQDRAQQDWIEGLIKKPR